MDKMREGMNSKLNNKGLSLVELIVAISIGVIVSGSIAALITFSIRTYRNESVNTSLQYELQSNLNMMMDEIMGAQTLVVVQNASGEPATQYAMFGNPNSSITLDDGTTAKGFKGVIFVPSKPNGDGKFKIYMKNAEGVVSGTISDFAENEFNNVFKMTFDDAGFNPDTDTSLTKYLLGENATQFSIVPDPNGTSLEGSTYTNPIEVKVELQFERNGWGTKKYSKHVDDITYLRNKVKDSIYIDGAEYKLKTKDE